MVLDLVRLRTLRAVHEFGSMAAAAVALGYTPGAVSQQMAALQRSLGSDLFVMVGRRAVLTEAGEVLAAHAGLVMDAEDAALRALEDLDNSFAVPVRIGVFATAAAELLTSALRQLRSSHPQLAVRTVEVHPDEASQAVSRGLVELAFGIDYDDAPIPRDTTVRFLELHSERFAIAYPAARAPQTVRLHSLGDESWILPPRDSQYGVAIRMACRRAGFEPSVVHEVTDTAASLAMVSAGLGITPVTDLMQLWQPSDVVAVRLHELVRRRIVLLCRRRPQLSYSARMVLATLSSRAQQLNQDPP